jgi:3-hydroxymyristoyl/3-hydroxydecanoyl-(acyl carrier protein) dehydratase
MRYFLIDRITALQPPERATGIKCVSLTEDIFSDHFPGHPILPGALILESLAQLSGVLIEATLRQRGQENLHAFLTMIDRARFRQMVRPGDKLDLEAIGMSATEDGGRARVLARVDGQLAAEAEMTFALAKVTEPRLIQRRREALDIWLHGSLRE